MPTCVRSFPESSRSPLGSDSDRHRHCMPARPTRPEDAGTCSALPSNAPKNTRQFPVGRSGKIGIIGLGTLRALGKWLAARKQTQVNGVDSCPSSRTEHRLPPAPTENSNASSPSTLESGNRSEDASRSVASSLLRRGDTTRDGSRKTGGRR